VVAVSGQKSTIFAKFSRFTTLCTYTYVFRKKVLQECLKKFFGPSYFENCLLSKK
jgi:hypothetical protein